MTGAAASRRIAVVVDARPEVRRALAAALEPSFGVTLAASYDVAATMIKAGAVHFVVVRTLDTAAADFLRTVRQSAPGVRRVLVYGDAPWERELAIVCVRSDVAQIACPTEELADVAQELD